MSELILEKDKLKVISVESRVNILKVLAKRRETLSDLSKKLKLSKPTLKEHLDILEHSGFIKKINSDNIWKYYELTEQGQKVLNPSGIKVLFLSITSFLLGVIFLIKFFINNNVVERSEIVNDNLLYIAVAKSAVEPATKNIFLDYAFIIDIILILIGLIIFSYYLYKKIKKK